MQTATDIWPRAIILVDMNAFFASIEQLDRPEWRGRPVAVTNGQQGTCIITCSYEARAWGIKTGMRLKQARERCPDLIQAPSNPHRYAEVSTAIMEALGNVSPDVEVFSVDEAFLDVTHCQQLWGPPPVIAQLVKKTVHDASGLLCSVGVSGDKTTAKYAAKLNKPNGLTIIPPWEAEVALRDVPVTELCGIAKGVGAFLAARGVHVCGDMAQLPVSELGKRFGNIGRRIWNMCQGKDPSPVEVNIAAPKSVGHGKVVPPATSDKEVLLTYLLHMTGKVASRMRTHQLQASKFFIGLRADQGWLGGKYTLAYPTQDSHPIMAVCHQIMNDEWQGEGIHQVQVTALNPSGLNHQMELFEHTNQQRNTINQVMDQINERYGDFSLMPGRLLKRSEMPNVIAPAWKPSGHRKTV